MNSSFPSRMERYASPANPSKTKMPTTSSVLVWLIPFLAPPRSLSSGADGPFGAARDELAHPRVLRVAHLVRRPGHQDGPLVQHGHLVGDVEHVRYVVADHHTGEPEAFVSLRDQAVDGVQH